MIKLPEADLEAFKVYIHWLYSATLDTTLMIEPINSAPPAYLNLTKLWVLGNFVSDHVFTNSVIDRLLLKLALLPGHAVSGQTLQYIWEHTPQNCGIQRLFIEATAARTAENHIETWKNEILREILLDLSKRYASGRTTKKSPTFADRCKYHTHENGEPKCQ